MTFLHSLSFSTAIEFLAMFAFTISGIRLASAKQFDWFGAFVVGLVTAVGGGTIRDLMLNLTPFWMVDSFYIVSSFLALIVVVIYQKILVRLNYTFFTFDTIGLALYVVVGIEKTLQCGFPIWVAIIMGMITGSAGGVIRDILINEVPLIFRKEIYALACLIGGIFYWLSDLAGLPLQITQIIAVISIIVTRVIAVKYQISLPALKGDIKDIDSGKL